MSQVVPISLLSAFNCILILPFIWISGAAGKSYGDGNQNNIQGKWTRKRRELAEVMEMFYFNKTGDKSMYAFVKIHWTLFTQNMYVAMFI